MQVMVVLRKPQKRMPRVPCQQFRNYSQPIDIRRDCSDGDNGALSLVCPDQASKDPAGEEMRDRTHAASLPAASFCGMSNNRNSLLLSAPMLYLLRFLWNATRGHRLTPWRSPYLLWRIETYCGVKMTQIGFLEFWEFSWRERKSLWRFLKWTGEMEHYARPGAKKN